ncbi:hypothetical protein MBLNU459_g4845t1 [Dothideomycetes sp. NU459]
MPSHKIVVFAGDNCGPEVMAEAINVLKAVERSRPDLKLDFEDHLLGGGSIDATGEPLTQQASQAAQSADAVLLGAIGGPKWGTGQVRPEQGLLKLRKDMQAFANLRPCNFIAESLVELSPLKASVCRGTDFILLRELTGGIYFGPRTEPDESLEFAEDTEPYSRAEIERVARMAGWLCMQHDPPLPMWSLDKANVLASTGRLWRQVVTRLIEKEFPEITLGHHLVDSAAMLMIKKPTALNGIVLTSNLFGDILSDESSVIPGSLGLLPSASLCAIPEQGKLVKGIYEPIHGSAPDIAGQGIVNPVGTILSAAMLLRYSLGLTNEAAAVEEAVRKVIDSGVRTSDVGGTASTIEFGKTVVIELEKLLR